MKTIWKYPLRIEDTQNVVVPQGAQILCIQTQNDHPCLWVLVNPDETATDVFNVETFGSGHPINEAIGAERKYIGTYQVKEGALIFHVFEYIGV